VSSRIRVLPDETINKVAAGEVIENPASVVKELVENAIDAGAGEVTIEIKGGGRQLIRVTDDGSGMHRDDAILSIERHATSKMHSAEDLEVINSLGFRGEALPSIAAISKLTMMTSPRQDTSDPEALEGTMLIIEGGKMLKCCSVVRSPGTTVEVKALFFNVPVRRKFQKSPSYDQGEIVKSVTLLALGHPHIKFQLIANNDLLLNTHVRNEDHLEARIADTLGMEYLSATIPLNLDESGIKMRGFIGHPEATRPNRTGQYLFINGRAIFSPLISRAVGESYGTTISPNRHPIFVLHVCLPGNDVDVNVHPQKREVRLRNISMIREMIGRAVGRALQAPCVSVTIPSPTTDTHEEVHWNQAPLTEPDIVPKLREKITFSSEEPTFLKEAIKPSLQVIATIPGYIIVDGSQAATVLPEQGFHNEGLLIVNGHAAHARVIFERFQAGTEDCHNVMEVQSLLVPVTLSFSPAEASVVQAHIKTLNALGINIYECGPNTFMVDAVPQLFEIAQVNDVIAEIIDELCTAKTTLLLQREREKILALTASHAAIGTNKTLTITEAQALIKQLLACSMPHRCPKGTPTIVQLNGNDLAKLFHKTSKIHS